MAARKEAAWQSQAPASSPVLVQTSSGREAATAAHHLVTIGESHSKESLTKGHTGEGLKMAHGQKALPMLLPAAAAYILTSTSLILFNKHALVNFEAGKACPNILLLVHCLMAVILVRVIQALRLTKQNIEPLRWNIIRLWLPVNLLFVAMCASSFLALRLVGVGMFTVLKNLSNLLTIIGDYYFFRKTYSYVVWLCILLMMMSALCGGITDMHFTWEGYTWQLLNCVFTSGYALYLSHVMSRVSQFTSDKQKLGELSMVWYNNFLSLGPVAALAAAMGEWQHLPKLQHALQDPHFLTVVLIGGLLGFAISFTSLWFMSRSSATVYSLTGSMNKVLVAVAGIMLFHEKSGLANLASIGVGLLAGLLFVLAKAYVPR